MITNYFKSQLLSSPYILKNIFVKQIDGLDLVVVTYIKLNKSMKVSLNMVYVWKIRNKYNVFKVWDNELD